MHTRASWWIAPALIALILGALLWITHSTRLRRIYEEHFQESRRERLFLASLGFFVAVAVVRGLTWLIHNNIGPFHDISMRGRHIHHLVWGILLLLLTGYCWVAQVGTGMERSSVWAGRITCLTYGVAAALTLDEFALWLNLRDVYWAREGRASLEALGLFAGILAMGIFGARFFTGIAHEVLRVVRRGA